MRVCICRKIGDLLPVRVLILSYALVLGASIAFGQSYQRTKDEKTLVWNAEPKPGDIAVWEGDRDAEQYATGVGTLTWYTEDGRVYGRYFGNMVKGRLDGQVNVHSNGRTAHAIFDHGTRVSPWGRGPAPSRLELNTKVAGAAEKRILKAEPVRKAEAVQKKPTPPVPTSSEVASDQATATETPKPKSSPKTERATATEEKYQRDFPVTEPTAIPTTGSEFQTSKTEQPMPDFGSPASNNERPTLNIEPSITEATTPRPTPEEVVAQPDLGLQKPLESPAPAPDSRSSAKAKMDESLRDLVRPPSSLHIGSTAEASPEVSRPVATPEVKSTPNAGAHLSQSEAIALADAEAVNQGGDLNQFKRPQADYSAAEHKWTLFYDQRPDGEMPELGKYFAVTVDDNTKKAEIKK